jgi:hypothetical protein
MNQGSSQPGHQVVAEVRITGERGIFVAVECELDGPWVIVAGRWRERTGPAYNRLRWGPPQRYTWSAERGVAICWCGAEAGEQPEDGWAER